MDTAKEVTTLYKRHIDSHIDDLPKILEDFTARGTTNDAVTGHLDTIRAQHKEMADLHKKIISAKRRLISCRVKRVKEHATEDALLIQDVQDRRRIGQLYEYIHNYTTTTSADIEAHRRLLDLLPTHAALAGDTEQLSGEIVNTDIDHAFAEAHNLAIEERMALLRQLEAVRAEMAGEVDRRVRQTVQLVADAGEVIAECVEDVKRAVS
ncbi:hypothetical protein J8273_7368 [Carpediemonas membranifera]|uniref:Uncharacterized protein n=1 Tax=Carpediemonas membranifera TaxID=201153 RepID=A0A8J6B1T6_9EUKA|nr:hypothetical protein J8273_7368 [Carpediemonas membranifera]|eukprot:KAG9391094.1 hypothetical protein J8273_7368 [Carpediemonas membranifera]